MSQHRAFFPKPTRLISRPFITSRFVSDYCFVTLDSLLALRPEGALCCSGSKAHSNLSGLKTAGHVRTDVRQERVLRGTSQPERRQGMFQTTMGGIETISRSTSGCRLLIVIV